SPPDTATLVDTTFPTSAASSPQYSTSNSVTVTYTANDPGTAASGLDSVDLYAKGPTDSVYSLVATDSTPNTTQSFSYTASEGDGSYSFFTRAADKAGNYEAAPASPPDTATLV